MAAILRVRKPDGTYADVPSLVGPPGADGYSPTVGLTQKDDGVEITVQNKDGTQQTANVLNGQNGNDAPQESVLYTAQTLTNEQQSQARANIGATSAEELNQLKTEKANESIVSDAWQTGKTYEKGAYCIYNNSLYKALVQTTAEPANVSDWKNVCITDELKPIRIKRIIGDTDSVGDINPNIDDRSVILCAGCDRQVEGCYTGFFAITPTRTHVADTYIWWLKCIDDNGALLTKTKVCIDVFYTDL